MPKPDPAPGIIDNKLREGQRMDKWIGASSVNNHKLITSGCAISEHHRHRICMRTRLLN